MKNKALKTVAVSKEPLSQYDILIEDRMSELFDTFDAVIAFAPRDSAKKLAKFRDKLALKLENPEWPSNSSTELQQLKELQLIEETILKLRAMVTVNVPAELNF